MVIYTRTDVAESLVISNFFLISLMLSKVKQQARSPFLDELVVG